MLCSTTYFARIYNTSIFLLFNTQDDCSIQTRAVDPKYDSLLQALMYSSDSEIEQAILKIPTIVTSVKDSVFKSLEVEVRHLCSVKADSILRYNDIQVQNTEINSRREKESYMAKFQLDVSC